MPPIPPLIWGHLLGSCRINPDNEDIAKPLYHRAFWMSSELFGERSGAGEGTRTPDPIITNDVLYQLSYTGTSLRSGVRCRRQGRG